MHVIDMSQAHGKRTKVTHILPVAQNVLSEHADDIASPLGLYARFSHPPCYWCSNALALQ